MAGSGSAALRAGAQRMAETAQIVIEAETLDCSLTRAGTGWLVTDTRPALGVALSLVLILRWRTRARRWAPG